MCERTAVCSEDMLFATGKYREYRPEVRCACNRRSPSSYFIVKHHQKVKNKYLKVWKIYGRSFLPCLVEKTRRKPFEKQLPRAREKVSTIETIQHEREIDPDYPACTVLLKGRIAITTFQASLCQLSSDAMRDGRQIPLLHIVDLANCCFNLRNYIFQSAQKCEK